VIFLPAYSPELNLIEILWRKINYEGLPVLAIAGLKAKDIMGYCLILRVITGIIISVGLTWL
jgi:short subunit fatty acids transporter